MPDPVLLIDLDGTLTRIELLPAIARAAGIDNDIAELTRNTMAGRIPFDASFRKRVDLLSNVPLDVVHSVVTSVPVFDRLLGLAVDLGENALVVTANLDVWVKPFFEVHGLRGIASEAAVIDGAVVGVRSILHKRSVLERYAGRTRIALGDGANDAPMARGAEVGIAWCGVHSAAVPLMDVANYAFADEERLCQFLQQWW